MNEDEIRDAESTLQRLRNSMRSRGVGLSRGLQRYATERFLYRLGCSVHRTRFVLKGATLFAVWGDEHRPTRDVDFTGFGSSDPQQLAGDLVAICATEMEGERIRFDVAAISIAPIREGQEYEGLRARIPAHLGTSRVILQIDVGFGDALVPGPVEVVCPTLLEDPPPRVLAYPRETVIAEKLHAMVVLDARNSRFKDFYDLYVIARRFEFRMAPLRLAVRATFDRRGTPIERSLPYPLTPQFYADPGRGAGWETFLARASVTGAPIEFDAVGLQLVNFLVPVWLGVVDAADSAWQPGGPWTNTT